MDIGYWIGCAVGLATFAISTWLALKERKEGDPDWRWGAALAVLGLVGTAVSAIQGVADAVDDAETDRRIAAAEAMAKHQPYGFDRASLVRSLRIIGPHAIDLQASRIFGDREADSRHLNERVDWLRECFREAGWTVSSTFAWPDEVQDTRLISNSLHEKDCPPFAKELVEALNTSGVQTTLTPGGLLELFDIAEVVEAAGEWPDAERNKIELYDWLRSQGIRLHLVVGLSK